MADIQSIEKEMENKISGAIQALYNDLLSALTSAPEAGAVSPPSEAPQTIPPSYMQTGIGRLPERPGATTAKAFPKMKDLWGFGKWLLKGRPPLNPRNEAVSLGEWSIYVDLTNRTSDAIFLKLQEATGPLSQDLHSAFSAAMNKFKKSIREIFWDALRKTQGVTEEPEGEIGWFTREGEINPRHMNKVINYLKKHEVSITDDSQIASFLHHKFGYRGDGKEVVKAVEDQIAKKKPKRTRPSPVEEPVEEPEQEVTGPADWEQGQQSLTDFAAGLPTDFPD